ncbi:hypothetical protein [Risungbinella massiliensis]|uniref:hypothetical protein n=1 Tax=Risungbinella massiliensis TaxID=1329796 RepID=UPI0012B54A4A|nr:hypothetical protein [Risungbinella massiliensis]
MFQLLLKAKQEYVTKTQTDQTFEKFLKSFQEFEKQMRVMEVKPSKESLYGRPFRG